MDGLQKVPLPDGNTLIVESTTHYQPDLGQDAYFAGIWPEKDGPLAKKWIPAPSPAAALEEGRRWAEQWLQENGLPAPQV